MKSRVLGCGIAMIAMVGCASTPTPPPPTLFVDSSTFLEVSGRARGWLPVSERYAVALLQDEERFALVLYRRVLEKSTWVWELACTSDATPGDDVDTFQWLRVGRHRRVVLMTSTRDPDGVKQYVAVLQPRTCKMDLTESLYISTEQDLVAPRGLRAGASVRGGVLRIIDSPKILSLRAGGHTARILTALRYRRLRSVDPVRWNAVSKSMLTATPVHLDWSPHGGEGPDAIAGDVRILADRASVALRSARSARVRATMPRPVQMMEWNHRCGRDTRVVLENGEEIVLGRVPVGNFPFKEILVAGIGIAPAAGSEGEERRDLWLLKEPIRSVTFELSAQNEAIPCNLSSRGFAWRLDSQTPPSY